MKMLSHKLVLVVIAVIVSICAANQSPLTFEEFLEFAKHSKGLPMSRILHISKRQVTRQSNPPRFGGSSNAVATLGAAANTVMTGMSRVVGVMPAYVIEGRHYWPTEFSLTKQFGLPGINELIGEVVQYERVRALRAARDSACRQRDNCIWNQRFAAVTNLIGRATDEQRLMRKIDCNVVFAGCEHYH